MSRTRASLSFFGDNLDPDEISVLLGASPTSSARMGEAWVTPSDVESKSTARTGRWQREVAPRRPGDLDSQISELLSPLTPDIEVWRGLAAKFSARIFCGLFTEEGNEGFDLRPETLVMIASRGLRLGFDIYGPPSLEVEEPQGAQI